jgi:glycosyltransferase involved in cell wall biosynthesis
MYNVDIIISVYNGEKYLKEQLNSIFAQNYQKFKILIRNNGSTDNTDLIINTYKKLYPNKIFIDPCKEQILPLYLSFSSLLKYSSSEYVMFSDADDVWLNFKIIKSLDEILKLENLHKPGTPCLVFTDLMIVDKDLNLISKSMFNFQSLKPNRMKLNYLLSQDIACGNTFIFNRALLNLIYPIPFGAGMHDIWTSLVAVTLGKVSYLNESTILYRQHESNICGSNSQYKRILYYFKNIKLINIKINEKFLLANSFLKNYNEILPFHEKNLIELFISIQKVGFFKKRYLIIKNKFFYNTIVATCAFLIFV